MTNELLPSLKSSLVVKAVVTGYAFFLISNPNHTLCVLVGNASAMCTNNHCKIL